MSSPIDPAEAQLLTGVYDSSNRNDRILYQLSRGDWATFLRLKLQYIDVLTQTEHVDYVAGGPVPGSRMKYARMCAFLTGQTEGQDNEWVEVEDKLGITWADQCRILANPRKDDKSRRQFLTLLKMDEDDRVDFEQAVRSGASIRGLAARWGLGYHLVHRIVLMFGRDL